jgi:hypothetical protein
MVNIRFIRTIVENIAKTGVGSLLNKKWKRIQIVKCVMYWRKIISKIKHNNQYFHQKMYINAIALIIRKNKLKISNHSLFGNIFFWRKKKQYSRHQTDINREIITNISNNDIILYRE